MTVFDELFYNIALRHWFCFFLHKSVSLNFTIFLVLICFLTPPFSYPKILLRISGIWGCNSKWNIWFEIIRKMDGGEETPFLDFATQMRLKSLFPNKGLMLAHQWVMVWFSKERKDPICHRMFQNYQKFSKILIFQSSKFKTDLKQKPTFFGLFWDKPLNCSQTQKEVFKYNCRFWTVCKIQRFWAPE